MKEYKSTDFYSASQVAENYATVQAEKILKQNREIKKSHRRYFNRVLFFQRVQKIYSSLSEGDNFLIFVKFNSLDDHQLVFREIAKQAISFEGDCFIKFDRSVLVDLSNLDNRWEYMCQRLFYLSPNGLFYFKDVDSFSKVLRIILNLEKEDKFLSSVLMIRDCKIFYDFSSSNQSTTLRSFYSTAQSKPEILLKVSDTINHTNFAVLKSLDSTEIVSRLALSAHINLPTSLGYNLIDFLKNKDIYANSTTINEKSEEKSL